MKNTSVILLATMILFGCADKNAQKKVILDSVMSIHNKVMAADGDLMNYKMQLDTIIIQKKLSPKDSLFMMRDNLVMADSAMDTWMHNFDYEQKGKTDDEVIAYMRQQKMKIMAVDSQITSAIARSKKYLPTKSK